MQAFSYELNKPTKNTPLRRGLEDIRFSTARPLFFKISATVTTVAMAVSSTQESNANHQTGTQL